MKNHGIKSTQGITYFTTILESVRRAREEDTRTWPDHLCTKKIEGRSGEKIAQK